MNTRLTFTNVPNIQFDFDQKLDRPVSYGLWKWLFDVVVASIVTVCILTWMIPVVGLLIKLTSPGPILFVQWRTGRYGQAFRCFKFRTMLHNGAHGQGTFRQTVYGDDRVTRIGQFLRKTNLDEMPQFLNVLIGDMSVVGPRPHAIQHDAEFWASLPNYAKRYAIPPGITGLAQVRGARGITDDVKKMEERLRYDLFYIRKKTLRHDVQICWWTVQSMFRGDPKAW